MMARRDAIAFINDVITWGERALKHIEGMDREKFLSDAKTQDAVDKCICNIGEASNKVRSTLRYERNFPILKPMPRTQCAIFWPTAILESTPTSSGGLLPNLFPRSCPKHAR
jgi:hypothetical protein